VGKVRFQLSMSLDGYVAGPNQSEEHPLGEGGEQLHEWAIANVGWRRAHRLEGGEENASTPVLERVADNVGAVIMGRNMFGPVRGGWGDGSWEGWWGDDPPFHVPVFVLTHHARGAIQKDGGTSFHFATDGLDSALRQARAAAGERDVSIAGGASTVQQCLRAGHVDEFDVHVVPVFLGAGERLFDGLGGDLRIEVTETIGAPGVTHLRYSVVR
jgi:dihydrofolate reductase